MVVKSPQTPGSPHMACVHPQGDQLLTSAPSAGAGPPFTPAQPTSRAASSLQTLQVELRDVLPLSVLP